MSETEIDALFDRLDSWRHFPAYQLERRADIFFALYLPEVLEGELGVRLKPTVIPELPIRRDLVFTDRTSRASVKVDYAAFSAAEDRVFFVELKTDQASRRDTQDTYLERATELGFGAIAGGIRDILLATSAHQKYFHLASALQELGFLWLPEDLADYVYPAPRRGLKGKLEQVRVIGDARVEVVYVQPDAADGAIEFGTFATYVDRHADPVSQRFARSLRTWASRVAGSVPPGGS